MFSRRTKGGYIIILSTNNKSVMLQIFPFSYYIIMQEKQKYHITSRSSKLSENIFFCGLCYDEILTAMNKLSNQIKNNFPSEGGELTFHVAKW